MKIVCFRLEANKEKSPLNVEKVLPNLLEKSIIDWFSLKGAWPILSISANVGGLTTNNSFSTGKPMETKIEAVRITQEEIKKLMKGNVFAPYFNHPAPLILPKKMKVHIERDQVYSKIVFKDRYCTLTIKIQTPVMGHIIQEHMPVSKFLKISKKDLEGTYVITARINMTAQFSRLLAGNPEMSTYKAWVNNKSEVSPFWVAARWLRILAGCKYYQ